MFVDSDDYISNTLIEKLVQSSLNSSPDIIRSGLVRIDEDGTILYKFFTPRNMKCEITYDNEYFKHNILKNETGGLLGINIKNLSNWFNEKIKGNISDSWNYSVATLYKREVAQKALSKVDVNLRLGEDALYNSYFFMFSKSLKIVDVAEYYYVQRPNSLTRRSNNFGIVQDKLLMYESRKKFVNYFNLDETYHEQYLGSVCMGIMQLVFTEKGLSIRDINSLLKQDIVATGFKKLNLHSLPLKFKIPLFLAKYKLSVILYLCSTILKKSNVKVYPK